MNKWISVKDSLPAPGRKCLLYDAKDDRLITGWWLSWGSRGTGFFIDNGDSCYLIDSVTHWMPLPDPPEVE